MSLTPQTQPHAITKAPPTALVPRSRSLPAVRSPGAITRRPQPRHGLDAAGTTLHVNTTAVPLEALKSYSASGFSEKDLSTAFATIGIFSLVAAVMIFGVVEIGWRTNFLLEGVLFGAIALCATAELFGARRQTLFTFELVLRDGSRATFVTADPEEATRVKAALDGVLPPEPR